MADCAAGLKDQDAKQLKVGLFGAARKYLSHRQISISLTTNVVMKTSTLYLISRWPPENIYLFIRCGWPTMTTMRRERSPTGTPDRLDDNELLSTKYVNVGLCISFDSQFHPIFTS